MVKGLVLTVRDSKLLYDCYQNVVLSFAQVHQRHFPKAARQTVNNRLTKLIKSGYLGRQRVGIMIYQNDPQAIGTVFQIARRGLHILKARYPTERFREEPIRLNTLTLYHDLLLTQTLDALRIRFPNEKIVNGKVFAGANLGRKRLPDAVIVDTSGRARVAIELELTLKSDSRYREIVLTYQISQDFPKVLYVVGTRSIAERIKYQITGRKESPGIPAMSTGKLHFVTLDTLLRDPKHVSMDNGTQERLAA